MGVPDKAQLLKPLENTHEFPRIRVNVIRKNVFIDRPARGGVHRDEIVGFQPNRHVAQVFPAIGPADDVGVVLKRLARPEASLLRAAVDVKRLLKDSKVLISHYGGAAVVDDQVEAFHGVRPVSDNVAEADNVLDPTALDLGEDRGKRFEIAVNIGNDREHKPSPTGRIPAAA
jgi:hypothetical protein